MRKYINGAIYATLIWSLAMNYQFWSGSVTRSPYQEIAAGDCSNAPDVITCVAERETARR